MVRLRVAYQAKIAIKIADFNSIMVRLREGQKKVCNQEFVEFQFHHGTIKGFIKSHQVPYYLQFQFHHGTIKGGYSIIAYDFEIKFQFHHGTIKG